MKCVIHALIKGVDPQMVHIGWLIETRASFAALVLYRRGVRVLLTAPLRKPVVPGFLAATAGSSSNSAEAWLQLWFQFDVERRHRLLSAFQCVSIVLERNRWRLVPSQFGCHRQFGARSPAALI